MGSRDYNFVPGNALELNWEELNTLYSDVDGSNPCYLVALDQRKISLILSHINRFPKYHWTWGLPSPRSSWTPEQRAQWEEIEAFVSETEFCLMSGCDLSDFNANVERIAVALESIDEKAVQRITWDDMMTDLANTLGITNAIYKILEWIGNLFPSFKVKADATPIIQMIFDHYFWRSLILAALGGINTSLATIAAAQVVEKPLILLQTIFQGFNSLLGLNNRIYDFILGDWNWYDDVIKPLWASFISDEEGGTGGENPDADPENRVITRVYNDVFVEGDAITCAPDVTVNCGGGCGGQPMTDTNTDITDFNDGPEVEQPDPEGDPPTGFESWGAYYTYRCQAANWLYDQYVGTLRNWGSFEGVVGIITLALIIGVMLLVVPPLGLAVVCGAIAALAAADIALFALFVAIADGLDAQKEDLVCGLYNATTTTEAIAALTDATDTIIDGLETTEGLKAHFKNACSNLLANNNVKVLFEKDDTLDGYEGSVGCEGCGPDCQWYQLEGGDFVDDGEMFNANGYNYGVGYSFIVKTLPEWPPTPTCGFTISLEIVTGIYGNYGGQPCYWFVHYLENGQLQTPPGFLSDNDFIAWLSSHQSAIITTIGAAYSTINNPEINVTYG